MNVILLEADPVGSSLISFRILNLCMKDEWKRNLGHLHMDQYSAYISRYKTHRDSERTLHKYKSMVEKKNDNSNLGSN